MLAAWSSTPSTDVRKLQAQILRLRRAVSFVSMAGICGSCSKPVNDVAISDVTTAVVTTAVVTTAVVTTVSTGRITATTAVPTGSVVSVVDAIPSSTSTVTLSEPANAHSSVNPKTAATQPERPRHRTAGAAVVEPEVAPSAADVTSPTQARPSPPASSKLTTTLPQTGEGYRTYAQVNTPVVVGKDSTVTIHLDPQAPFKSNDKYPYRFTVTGSRGVTSSTQVVTSATITPTKTTLQLSLEGDVPGPGSLAGMFSFSVCTPEKCLVERTPLVLNFEVVADTLSASPRL